MGPKWIITLFLIDFSSSHLSLFLSFFTQPAMFNQNLRILKRIQVAVFYLMNWNNDFGREKNTSSPHFIFFRQMFAMCGHFCFRLHTHTFVIASGSVEMSVCPVQIGAAATAACVVYYLTNNNIVGHLKNGACVYLTAHSLSLYFFRAFSLNDKTVTVSFNCYLPLSLFGKYVYYCFISFHFIVHCIDTNNNNKQVSFTIHR